MTYLKNSTLRLILPLAAVVVFAMLLTFSLIRMFEIENGMRVEAEQNMLWVLHQSEVAAIRLSETAALADLGEATPDDLSLRFDLLVSRFSLLNDGPQRRFLESIGLSDDLDYLSGTLVSIAPLIAGFTLGDGAPLRVALAPFPRLFGRAANAAMIAEWDELGGRLEVYRDQLRQIIASLIGIMVAGGILAMTLVLALRQARQRNRMLRRERDFSALLVSSSGEGILAVERSNWQETERKTPLDLCCGGRGTSVQFPFSSAPCPNPARPVQATLMLRFSFPRQIRKEKFPRHC